MMKMLVELDENKVLSEGKYSLDKMNSFISNAFKRMYKYFQGKAIWEAKMSEPLHVRIISTPREGVRKH